MIDEDRELLIITLFVLIDDIWQEIGHQYARRGPAPTTCSDSERITIAVVSACWGITCETHLHAAWQPYRHLFPRLPERSWFNRRRRNLAEAINHVRRCLVAQLDVALDVMGVIDSMPLPVIRYHLAGQRSREWDAHAAEFGYCAAKKQHFFGYRLHLLTTAGGVILDFALTGAATDEREIAAALLPDHAQHTILADKGYVSAPVAEALAAHHIRLIALRRANQPPLEPSVKRLVGRFREVIETVNSQLADRFHLQRTRAHSAWGVAARVVTSITAHTCLIALNRAAGVADWLQLAPLAFPQPTPTSW